MKYRFKKTVSIKQAIKSHKELTLKIDNMENIFGSNENIKRNAKLKLEIFGEHEYYFNGDYNINADQWNRIHKILFEEYQEKMDSIHPC